MWIFTFVCLDQVRESMRTATEDVKESEDALMMYIQQNAMLQKSVKEFPSGAVLNLGDVIIALLELSWGWLTVEGEVHEATHTELPLHSKVS